MPNDGNAILSTERLVLRYFRSDEAAAVADYKNDPEVAQYGDWDLPYPVEEIADKIANYAQRPWPCLGRGLNVAIDYDGVLIGDFGAGWNDEGTEAEIGFTLLAKYHGTDLATEIVGAVVDRLFSDGVEHITMSLGPEDAASIGVLATVGFRHQASSQIEIRGEWVADELHALSIEDRAASLARAVDPAE